MRCTVIQERMADYVTGGLPAPMAARIEAHLEKCGACRAWYGEVADTARLWAEDDGPLPGLNLVDPVLERLAVRTVHPFFGCWAKRGLGFLDIRVFLHYGLAASMTLVLFQLGIFEHLGAGLSHNSLLLSGQVQKLLDLFTRY